VSGKRQSLHVVSIRTTSLCSASRCVVLTSMKCAMAYHKITPGEARLWTCLGNNNHRLTICACEVMC